MTIDEAIAKYNKLANNDRTCHPEEAQQLAEWLEELKALREEKSDFQIYAKDIAEANYEMGMENGYNKAIDDCKELTFREVVYCDSLNDRTEFRELAEQLKAKKQ